MRPIEIILILSILARLWFSNKYRNILGFLPILVAAAQVLFEGYRWQMIPLYILAAASGLVAAVAALRRRAPPAGRRRLAQAIGGTLLVLLAAALPYIFPIPRPYPPTGPYPIGTRTLHLVDASRTDPHAPDPASPREFLVQLWYPAELTPDARPAPWMPDAEIIAPEIAKALELPGFFLDHLIYARTDSYLDLPVATDGSPFPAILFSHGYTGFRAQNTFQVQELASRGYIVAAVEHTYAAAMTVFPDGRVAPHNPETLPPDGDPDYEADAEELLKQWTGDLQFTLASLDALNADPGSWLLGSLDLSRVGTLGHSTGGGAAIQFCSAEPRCRAGFAMDPWLLPVENGVLEAGLNQPFLAMFSEAWSTAANVGSYVTLADGYPGELTVMTVLGSDHFDFTDLPLTSPLSPYLGVKGPIAGDRMLSLVNAFTVDFFDAMLRGASFELPYEASDLYPEIRFAPPEGLRPDV